MSGEALRSSSSIPVFRLVSSVFKKEVAFRRRTILAPKGPKAALTICFTRRFILWGPTIHQNDVCEAQASNICPKEKGEVHAANDFKSETSIGSRGPRSISQLIRTVGSFEVPRRCPGDNYLWRRFRQGPVRTRAGLAISCSSRRPSAPRQVRSAGGTVKPSGVYQYSVPATKQRHVLMTDGRSSRNLTAHDDKTLDGCRSAVPSATTVVHRSFRSPGRSENDN